MNAILDLQHALATLSIECEEATNRLVHLASNETENEVYDLTRKLNTAAYLVGCLWRLVGDRTPNEIFKAFRSPGDFGYGTPIGSALHQIYDRSKAPK